MTRTSARSFVALACALALVLALAAPFAPAVLAILVAVGMVLDPGGPRLLRASTDVPPSSPLVAASVPARAPPA